MPRTPAFQVALAALVALAPSLALAEGRGLGGVSAAVGRGPVLVPDWADATEPPADAAGIAPGQHLFNVSRPEGTRYYYVWVPKSYDASRPAPLYLAFHGLNDNCLNFGHATGFIQFAEENGFLFVYPCGTIGLLGIAWNAGVCCLPFNTVTDDFAFASTVVSNMKGAFNVDAGRVYAAGFSNGAFLAESIGCQQAGTFAATASVSGVTELKPGNSGGIAACDAAYANSSARVSTMNVHGTLDFVVPFTGDALLGFPPIPDDMDAWARRNGCKPNATVTFQRGPFTGYEWPGCDDNSTVSLVVNKGGTHEWPMTGDFNTTSAIVEFFSKHSRG